MPGVDPRAVDDVRDELCVSREDVACLRPVGLPVPDVLAAPPLSVDGYALNPRRRNELATTETLDSAMAAPAISGLRSPNAASGIAATL